MESDQVKMSQISNTDQSNNKESVILRALVTDPNRHKPLAQHPTAATSVTPNGRSTTSSNDLTPTPMYTLESRYRPIPEKALPKHTETKLYYLNANSTQHSQIPSPPITNEEQDTPSHAKPEETTNIAVVQEPSSIVFLEPKIISQPVLYCIVGEKTIPTLHHDQPVPINKDIPSPLFYTITGNVRQPTVDMSKNTVPVQSPVRSPVLEKPVILYSLIGNPNPRIQIQESNTPVQRVQEPIVPISSPSPQVSAPSFYSVVGNPHVTPKAPEPLKQTLSVPQQSTPNLYTVVGNPHVLPKTSEPIKQVLSPALQKSTPTVYTVIGNPHVPSTIPEPVKPVSSLTQQSTGTVHSVVGSPHILPKIQEPVKNVSSQPKESSASFYSIVGHIVRTPATTDVNTVNLSTSTQPVKVNQIPVLYTIVSEKKIPSNVPKEKHRSTSPPKKRTTDNSLYTIIGDPTTPQKMTLSQKTQPLQPHKQQPVQPLAQISSLYTLVGKPHSPSRENMNTRPKSPIRTRAPLPKIAPTRRRSPSEERLSAPEAPHSDFISAMQTKPKRPARSKEPTIPKSETVFIPLRENERPQRRQQLRTTPWHISPGQTHRRAFNIPQHGSLELRDYISPYAYHPSKPYREQTRHPPSLPIVKKHHSERKPRSPLYESRSRTERKHPHDSRVPHSLDRHPGRTSRQPRLWDYEKNSQTDVDDDDLDESDTFRRKQNYRHYRPRLPWAPVW